MTPRDPSWGPVVAVIVARVGGAAPFQAYAGALPFLQREWGMTGSDSGALAFSWQVAFAVSLVIFSWLIDRVGPRRVFVASSWATAAAVALVPLFADGYVAGLLLSSRCWRWSAAEPTHPGWCCSPGECRPRGEGTPSAGSSPRHRSATPWRC